MAFSVASRTADGDVKPMMAGLRHRARRRAVAELIRSGSGPLADYYRHPPAVDRDAPWRAAPYLVLEVEATGPDAPDGGLQSVGWLLVDGGVIAPGSAQYVVVDTGGSGRASAENAVAVLLEELRDRVLVCHNSERSIGVLSPICRQKWGLDFWPWNLVDPMQWHLSRSGLRRSRVRSPEVGLSALLDRYGLPPTEAHAALSEAFATALVFLAMAETSSRPDNGGPRRLGELLDSRSWTM